MNVNLTKKLEILQVATDYTPVFSTKDPGKINLGTYSRLPIIGFTVAKNTGTGNIKLWALNNDTPVEIPSTGLLVGHTYYMLFKKYEVTGTVDLVLMGYNSVNIPVDL